MDGIEGIAVNSDGAGQRSIRRNEDQQRPKYGVGTKREKERERERYRERERKSRIKARKAEIIHGFCGEGFICTERLGRVLPGDALITSCRSMQLSALQEQENRYFIVICLESTVLCIC